eukprot:scaffold64257_cov74-Cyclotella_meneghiniana.AAC.3
MEGLLAVTVNNSAEEIEIDCHKDDGIVSGFLVVDEPRTPPSKTITVEDFVFGVLHRIRCNKSGLSSLGAVTVGLGNVGASMLVVIA